VIAFVSKKIFQMTLQEVLQLAKQLTPIDKVRLIQQLTPDLEREFSVRKPSSKKSLLGLCADLGKAPSESEIERTRNEVWNSFPREDI
jgi:hypothetical protein